MMALLVSISASMSPAETSERSLTCHVSSTPVSLLTSVVVFLTSRRQDKVADLGTVSSQWLMEFRQSQES